MNPLNLAYTLELKEGEIIAAYGAGGKSTLLYRLAQELAGTQRRVLLTTTTKILRPDTIPSVICSALDEALDKLEQYFKKGNTVALGSSFLPDNKIKGIETVWLEEIARNGIASYILIEADGAARKPIKGFAPYEPVLPPNASLLLPVLGLDALGLKLDSKNVHRPKLLGRIAGIMPGEQINIDHINHYLKYVIKIGMEAVPRSRIVPVINKMDLIDNFNFIQEITRCLSGYPVVDRLLFSALQETFPVKFVFVPSKPIPFISCVILAAGSSERMGRDKLALKIKGKTVLEHSVKNALSSRVGEVIVVTRPESGWVKELFAGRTVKVVVNPFYRQGISSSLKEGLRATHPLSQGVIFALGDQPFIPAEVYNTLIETYTHAMHLVTCPLFKGKRGNPVLFDRRSWPLLLNLEGDRGGKQIFPFLPEQEIYCVETSCAGILKDIDTPEEYQDILSHLR